MKRYRAHVVGAGKVEMLKHDVGDWVRFDEVGAFVEESSKQLSPECMRHPTDIGVRRCNKCESKVTEQWIADHDALRRDIDLWKHLLQSADEGLFDSVEQFIKGRG